MLDEQKCRSNISKINDTAAAARIELRPHFKTHVSHEIGNWFRETGISKIAVSSLKMAEYFAAAGWDDILLAIPLNLRTHKRINRLASKLQLSLLVEDIQTLFSLQALLSNPVSVSIKLDTGYRRTGIPVEESQHERILQLARAIQDHPLTNFAGTVSHAGHSYHCRELLEIEQVHKKSLAALEQAAQLLYSQHPELIHSVGDTPTCSTMKSFGAANELRAGNYVFYDLTQAAIGSCDTSEIALAMACPVIAIHADRQELIIHGGSVHFAQDKIEDAVSPDPIHGLVVPFEGSRWGSPTGSYLKKLSQEHGTVHLCKDDITRYKPGDLIFILPVHACTCANLMGNYLTTQGKYISRMPTH